MEAIENDSVAQWDETVLKVSKQFKVTADFDFILFIIGLNMRGLGFRHYSRDEKWDLINLGKCTLFENLGYLKKSGTDDMDWPTFETIKNVNTLTPTMQKHLLKKAMVSYIDEVMK